MPAVRSTCTPGDTERLEAVSDIDGGAADAGTLCAISAMETAKAHASATNLFGR